MHNASGVNTNCPVSNRNSKLYCMKQGAQYFIEKTNGTIFQHPMPTVNDMASYADSEYSEGVYNDYFKAKDLKILTAENRLKLINKIATGNRLLDIGCSCGFFMEAASGAGFDVTGIDFSRVAISMAAPSIRPKIVHGDVNTLISQNKTAYNVVTAFDIIEHTHNPLDFLTNVHKILSSNGLLVITTPDTGHILRFLMGSRWPMLQPMQHTVLFSKKTIREALYKAGFEVITISATNKILTIKYLIQQLKETSPLIYKIHSKLHWMIPERLSNKPISVNIGELIAFARKK